MVQDGPQRIKPEEFKNCICNTLIGFKVPSDKKEMTDDCFKPRLKLLTYYVFIRDVMQMYDIIFKIFCICLYERK